MDKILIQESLAPLLEVLNNGNNTTNTGTNNNANIMKSTLINNLLTTGQYTHNPGTENVADNVIIKPQDLAINELPTGRCFMDKPTYQIAIENPVECGNKEFINIGIFAQTIDKIIEVKAVVSIFNSYSFNFQVRNNSLVVSTGISSYAYVNDNMQLFGAIPKIEFDLIRKNDGVKNHISFSPKEEGTAQTVVEMSNISAEDSFLIQNFSFSDNLNFTDQINETVINANGFLNGVKGNNSIKEALMNVDVHYKCASYPSDCVQLLYSSEEGMYSQNKFNKITQGTHRIDALILEYTKTS